MLIQRRNHIKKTCSRSGRINNVSFCIFVALNIGLFCMDVNLGSYCPIFYGFPQSFKANIGIVRRILPP
jgi:hypothetical protein